MVNWSLLQNATSSDNKPTPGWLFHEICLDVRSNPKDTPDVAEYLMQCVCSDQLNVQLKAVLAVKHLAAEDVTFQLYMQACSGAIRVLEDIAAPPIVPQARALEPQEVRTVREATDAALRAIRTPHTVERSTEAASLKTRIQGFGNFEPPPEECDVRANGVAGHAAEFVADSIGDMVDDFREKGAVTALKDATVDALDLVLDGVDTIWGWVAGKSEVNQPRICQPTAPVHGAMSGGSFMLQGAPGVRPGAFAPPPAFASKHYAAAFGGAAIGANNPVHMGQFGVIPLATYPAPGTFAAPIQEEPKPKAPTAPVDLLSMDEPAEPAAPKQVMQTIAEVDLLGDIGPSTHLAQQPQPQASVNMLDF